MSKNEAEMAKKVRIYTTAALIVVTESVYLAWTDAFSDANLWDSVWAFAKSVSLIAICIVAGNLIVDRLLWKTALGRKMGFPPDYSGRWRGWIIQDVTDEHEQKTPYRVQARVRQEITRINVIMEIFDPNLEASDPVSRSHYLVGQVLDGEDEFDRIIGVYRVTLKGGPKGFAIFSHEGANLFTVSNGGRKMDGVYYSARGAKGTIVLERSDDPVTGSPSNPPALVAHE